MSWDATLYAVAKCPLSPAEVAWLAGLLEGEGCFRLRKPSGRIRGNLDVQINMTDEDVIRRAHAVSQLGTCHGPYQRPGNRKPFWVWKVSGSNDALALMEAILPWMGDRRREQIAGIISEWTDQEPRTSGRTLELCTWRPVTTEAIADFNYTHNTNGMIAAAYEAVTGEQTAQCDGPLGPAIGAAWWKRLDGASGGEGRKYLSDIIRGLEADPARFRAMNPPNGWGDYDRLLGVLREMREAVPADDDAEWHVSG